jgi:GNAT superfamily N-acetyltransferase
VENPVVEPIAIRRAAQSDNALLSELGAATFAETFGATNTPEDMQGYLQAAFSPDLQAGELADPATVFLIAEIAGQPAGYARLREARPSATLDAVRPVELVRLYARARWIGRGVGAALMDASLQQAIDNGCDVMWLGVWERNERAIAFYRKWAFREFGSHAFLLGKDLQNDLLMARPVSR